MCVCYVKLTAAGSLKAQQLLTAANVELPNKVEQLSRELWMRVWSRVSSYGCYNYSQSYLCSTSVNTK